MKICIRLVAVILAIVCLAAMFTSCGSSNIVGRWRASDLFGGSVEYEFTSDGKFNKYSSGTLIGEYTYNYKDETIEYVDGWDNKYYMTVEDINSKEMVLSDGGLKITFKRVK